MRIALAKLLLQKPEFMMLDEPTNHLDLEARNWLEDYLADYDGGIILVSHDHYFLDRVTKRTAEVTRGGLIDYNGNYSYYLSSASGALRRSSPPTRSNGKKSNIWKPLSAASAIRRARPSWFRAGSSSWIKSNA